MTSSLTTIPTTTQSINNIESEATTIHTSKPSTSFTDKFESENTTIPTSITSTLISDKIISSTITEIPPETIIETYVNKTILYYPACENSFISLVDALNSIGVDSSYSNRKSIAELNGISDYSGTAEQNIELLNKLKNGILIKSILEEIINVPTIKKTHIITQEKIQETIIDVNTQEEADIPKVVYFPKCDSFYTSINDALESLNFDKSSEFKKDIAEVNNITNYKGTAKQNEELLNKLKQGLLIRPLDLIPKHNLTQSEIDKIIKNLENCSKFPEQKKTTIINISKNLLNSKKFELSFIAGILGNINNKGNVGLFENSNYRNESKKPNYLKIMENRFSYKDKYSDKLIYDLSLFEIKEMLYILKSEKFLNGKFGLGFIQWTGNRTYFLFQKYLEENGNNDKISFEQTCSAEGKMIIDELSYSGPYYSDVYKEWKKDGTPYYAGNLICKKYESPKADVPKINTRSKDSEEIYNIMIS